MHGESALRGGPGPEDAAELFLTEQTVTNHVSRILGTLGLHDRTQIVVTADGSGLVSAGR